MSSCYKTQLLLLGEEREARREAGGGTEVMFLQFGFERDGAKSTQERAAKTKQNKSSLPG